ncbi:LysR family transcriptional regulator [Nakamurella sp. GG22]
MDIHHLRYFVAVATTGSFVRAADQLGVSASPLNRRIRDLERYMGGPLFNRGTQPLTLTHAGHQLLPLADQVIADMSLIESARGRLSGTRPLSVGLVPTVPLHITRLIDHAVEAERPGTVVDYRPGSSVQHTDAVLAGTMDLATVRVVDTDPRLGRSTLVREPLSLVTTPRLRHRFASDGTPTDLSGLQFVTSYPPKLVDDLSVYLHEVNCTDIRVVAGADAHALLALVSHGAAFTCVADATSAENAARLADLGLSLLPPFRPVYATTSLIWPRRRSDLSGIVKRILRATTASVEDHSGPP